MFVISHSVYKFNAGTVYRGAWGIVVVKALHYYSDDPGVKSRRFHLIFQ